MVYKLEITDEIGDRVIWRFAASDDQYAQERADAMVAKLVKDELFKEDAFTYLCKEPS